MSRSETADAKLKEWLNLVDRTLWSRVCFVACKERKPHSPGMEVPWHFHILVASLVAMPKKLLDESWRTLVSPAARRPQEAAAVNDSVAAEDGPDQPRQFNTRVWAKVPQAGLGPLNP